MQEEPQFGVREPLRWYRRRPCAFGLADRDGRLAVVRITRKGKRPRLDLPGGALDGGESGERAMEREFGEETGLSVRAGPLVARARQFVVKRNAQRVNNLAAFFAADVLAEDRTLKVEDDHELIWLDPLQALTDLRHPSHAWAVACWLRSR
ncbi:MAG TPA: NUDIX domain-containing protein [Caulobacteraceae bacterium]|jgi:8-oxo-dGTP diphosphatase